MVAANTNRKSAQSQVDTWQDTLRDCKAQMMTDKQQQVAPERDKTTLLDDNYKTLFGVNYR
ncbi:hypothetical protein DVH92_18130 [Salmonella enterica]|nr:hypothetical protein [Salmonella enterica]